MNKSKDSLNRRKFLGKSITGAAGVIILPKTLTAREVSLNDKNITYRVLGKTGLKVPVIGFGVVKTGSTELCKTAFMNGISFFEISCEYTGPENQSIPLNIFRDLPRESITVAIKVRHPGTEKVYRQESADDPGNYYVKLRTCIENSGLDYIDILIVGDISNPCDVSHKLTVSAIEQLKKEKKIRFAGISTHSNIIEVIRSAVSTEIWDVAEIPFNYILEQKGDINEALHLADNAGLGIIATETTAGRFLDKERTKPVNVSGALKFAISNSSVDLALSGISNYEQLVTVIGVLADPILTENEMNELNAISGEAGLYCTNCNECIPACRMKLPVPALMRAYMYAYGYENPGKAYHMLGELGTGVSPCLACGECTVKCQRGFNIKEKISDISRMVAVPPEFIS